MNAQESLDAAPLPPMPAGYEAWTYYDMRRGVLFDPPQLRAWVAMLGGPANVRCLALSPRLCGDGVRRWRGQFFIASEGMARMLADPAWKAEAERAQADAQAVAAQRAAAGMAS